MMSGVRSPYEVQTKLVGEPALQVWVTYWPLGHAVGGRESDETNAQGEFWHLLAPPDVPSIGEQASVIVAATPTEAVADDVLSATRRAYPGARVVAAVTQGSGAALVWVRTQMPAAVGPGGYTVRVRSTEPGLAELYPSAIYGWMRWWALEQQRAGSPPGVPLGALLPLPPQTLEMRTRQATSRDWQRAQLDITEDNPGPIL